MGFFLGMLFGAIGSGYLVYAKRQSSALFACFGAALILYPYFFENVLLVLLIGALLIAAPFVIQRMS